MKITQFIPPGQKRLALFATQTETAPVLIYGSSGTGKGTLARWIHQNSPRSLHPFIVASKETPLSEQLPLAQNGTFLIPEIGARPLSEQKMLLGFLENKTIPLSDSSQTQTCLNVRIMVTTSQSLEGRAQGGLFNIKLLEKLNVFRLEMPPLCKRTEEFKEIVLGVMREITQELHKEHLTTLQHEAWTLLQNYDWPGNLRELRNVLRIAVLNSKGDQIEAADLPEFGHDRLDFRSTREEFEKTYIVELLKSFDWQIDTTCRMTRMDKNTLLKKIQKYGISRPELSIP